MGTRVGIYGALGTTSLVTAAVVLGGCAASSGEERSAGSSTALPDTRVVVVGDQSTGGTTCGGKGSNNWSKVLTEQVDIGTARIETVADQGAGYVGRGDTGSTLADLAVLAVRDDTTTVFVVGGARDADQLSGLDGAADAMVKSVKRTAPRATVVMVGPLSPAGEEDRAMAAVDDALRRVAERTGARFMSALDWAKGGANPFCPGTYQLTDEGQRQLGEHMAQTVQRLAG